jgi:hypothetical protein
MTLGCLAEGPLGCPRAILARPKDEMIVNSSWSVFLQERNRAHEKQESRSRGVVKGFVEGMSLLPSQEVLPKSSNGRYPRAQLGRRAPRSSPFIPELDREHKQQVTTA